MDFAGFRAQLAADLVQAVPTGVKVGEHPGRFDLAEVERYSVEAPCVRVALLSAADADLAEPYSDVECSAYILTKTGKAGLADKQLLTLGVGLSAYLRYFAVGGDDAQSPQQIKFTNLYSTSVGKDGIALGAVTWRQRIPLAAPPAAGSLADFLKFYADWNVGQDAASPEAEDRVDYPSS
ncbi:MAG: hypothetical protein QJR02_08360 [Sinobacteraceae bacterium]|nr:hypothetical protein [Nevskiaceae bacterium]